MFENELKELDGLSAYVEHVFFEEHAYNSFVAIKRGMSAIQMQENNGILDLILTN